MSRLHRARRASRAGRAVRAISTQTEACFTAVRALVTRERGRRALHAVSEKIDHPPKREKKEARRHVADERVAHAEEKTRRVRRALAIEQHDDMTATRTHRDDAAAGQPKAVEDIDKGIEAHVEGKATTVVHRKHLWSRIDARALRRAGACAPARGSPRRALGGGRRAAASPRVRPPSRDLRSTNTGRGGATPGRPQRGRSPTCRH